MVACPCSQTPLECVLGVAYYTVEYMDHKSAMQPQHAPQVKHHLKISQATIVTLMYEQVSRDLLETKLLPHFY